MTVSAGGAGKSFIVALLDLAGSATEDAAIITDESAGMVAGAV